LTFVDCTDGGCDDKNKDQLPISEELQRINDELEKEYLFALKKVDSDCRVFFVNCMHY